MSATKNQRNVLEISYPLRVVAVRTICCREDSLDIFGSPRPDMEGTRTVACLTSGVLEIRRFLLRSKPTGLPVSGGMTFEAFPKLRRRQPPFHLFDALKGAGLFCRLPETGVLGFVTIPAGLDTHVACLWPDLGHGDPGASEKEEPDRYRSAAGANKMKHDKTAFPPQQNWSG